MLQYSLNLEGLPCSRYHLNSLYDHFSKWVHPNISRHPPNNKKIEGLQKNSLAAILEAPAIQIFPSKKTNLQILFRFGLDEHRVPKVPKAKVLVYTYEMTP